jgi:ribosomal protein S18 acetylase RimI-like enzyme
MSGPNLLSVAFGPSEAATLDVLTRLADEPGTVFSYDHATVAQGPLSTEPIGICIGLSSNDYENSHRQLAHVFGSAGIWRRLLRRFFITAALERCVTPVPGDTFYISILAVDTQWRRSGIGTMLLSDAESQARVCGAKTLCLDVEVGNPDAERLYTAFGLQRVCERLASKSLRRLGVSGLIRMSKTL